MSGLWRVNPPRGSAEYADMRTSGERYIDAHNASTSTWEQSRQAAEQTAGEAKAKRGRFDFAAKTVFVDDDGDGVTDGARDPNAKGSAPALYTRTVARTGPEVVAQLLGGSGAERWIGYGLLAVVGVMVVRKLRKRAKRRKAGAA